MSIKINFVDFWGDFEPHNNFLFEAFKYLGYNVHLAPVDQCDIIFYSCCGNSHKNVNRSKTKKVFYTGENIRPNYNECDLSLSFDLDSDKNIRVPLYLLYIDFFGIGSWGNPFYLLPYDLIDDNSYKKTEKNKFCCGVFSNPTPERLHLVNLIGGYKKVDCYGRPFGTHSHGEHIKYKILSQYKFSICPENTRYPGYVTEKLFHAKTAGNIPIYSGSNDIDFNPACYIDIDQHPHDLLDVIIEIDKDDTKYQNMLKEPIFKKEIYESGGIYSKLNELKRIFC